MIIWGIVYKKLNNFYRDNKSRKSVEEVLRVLAEKQGMPLVYHYSFFSGCKKNSSLWLRLLVFMFC